MGKQAIVTLCSCNVTEFAIRVRCHHRRKTWPGDEMPGSEPALILTGCGFWHYFSHSLNCYISSVYYVSCQSGEQSRWIKWLFFSSLRSWEIAAFSRHWKPWYLLRLKMMEKDFFLDSQRASVFPSGKVICRWEVVNLPLLILWHGSARGLGPLSFTQ